MLQQLVCDKVARRGVANIRLLSTTAEDLLFRLLRPASVAAISVLFPDPWPKKRHHKRRLFKPEVAAAMASALCSGSTLRAKSDHAGYADVIFEVLSATPTLIMVDADGAFEGMPHTGFESKYRLEGRTIHAFAAVKE